MTRTVQDCVAHHPTGITITTLASFYGPELGWGEKTFGECYALADKAAESGDIRRVVEKDGTIRYCPQ